MNNHNFPSLLPNNQNNTSLQVDVLPGNNHNYNISNGLDNSALIKAENQIERYFTIQRNLATIYQNEHNRYNYLKSSQDNLLNSINFGMFRIWRYKNKFYYRP